LRRWPWGRRQTLIGAAAALVPLAVVVGLLVSSGSSAPPIAPKGAHGYDVSWPQCSGSNAATMPAGNPAYVILGLTDGPGHTVNPCLGSQLSWVHRHGSRVGAYLVVTYPTPQQLAQAGTGLYGSCGTSLLCQLHNDGAAQAAQAVATMKARGLRPPRVWMDVEMPPSRPWSRRTARNVAVLQGVVRGLTAARLPVGVYTTSFLWGQVAGNFELDLPNWLPSGDGSARNARARCLTTATGGPTWLVQYTRTLDSDLTCPVLGASRGHHDGLWPYRLTTQSLGSTGAAVRALQHVVGAPVTGRYGASTAAAVSVWQRTYRLPVTGTVAPADWRVMGADRVEGRHGLLLTQIASPS
jgi:Putative peptidoglycan binding domain